MTYLCWLWLLQLPSSLPNYRVDSLVNAASQTVDRFSPNSILTLYGTNLSFGTSGVNLPPNRPAGSLYPDELAGVRVYVSTFSVELFYVSPTQINFRVPANLRPSTHMLHIFRDGIVGPQIPVRFGDTAPELFTGPDNWLLATRPDGSVVTADQPVRPGETIVFYGTGFGPTIGDLTGLQRTVNWLAQPSNFTVLVNGESIPGIYYVGVTPGFSGLYQVNFTLPKDRTWDPNVEIRVAANGDRSREGTKLFYAP